MLGALQALDPDASGDGSGGFSNVVGKKQSGTRGIILRVILSNDGGATLTDGANRLPVFVGNFPASQNVVVTSLPTATGLAATQASSRLLIAAGKTTATQIKQSAGRLFDVLVTAQGTQAVMITDGPGGDPIGMINANATPGRYPFNSPAFTSIDIAGNANNPGLSVNYA